MPKIQQPLTQISKKLNSKPKQSSPLAQTNNECLERDNILDDLYDEITLENTSNMPIHNDKELALLKKLNKNKEELSNLNIQTNKLVHKVDYIEEDFLKISKIIKKSQQSVMSL